MPDPAAATATQLRNIEQATGLTVADFAREVVRSRHRGPREDRRVPQVGARPQPRQRERPRARGPRARCGWTGAGGCLARRPVRRCEGRAAPDLRAAHRGGTRSRAGRGRRRPEDRGRAPPAPAVRARPGTVGVAGDARAQPRGARLPMRGSWRRPARCAATGWTCRTSPRWTTTCSAGSWPRTSARDRGRSAFTGEPTPAGEPPRFGGPTCLAITDPGASCRGPDSCSRPRQVRDAFGSKSVVSVTAAHVCSIEPWKT